MSEQWFAKHQFPSYLASISRDSREWTWFWRARPWNVMASWSDSSGEMVSREACVSLRRRSPENDVRYLMRVSWTLERAMVPRTTWRRGEVVVARLCVQHLYATRWLIYWSRAFSGEAPHSLFHQQQYWAVLNWLPCFHVIVIFSQSSGTLSRIWVRAINPLLGEGACEALSLWYWTIFDCASTIWHYGFIYETVMG